ncbi:MAG: hypothetical protein ABIU05_08415, partial [Nitrospirales bacterium]
KHTLSFEGTRSWGVDEGEGDGPCRRCGRRLRARVLSEHGAERLPKRGLIGRGQSSKLLKHKGRVDGG